LKDRLFKNHFWKNQGLLFEAGGMGFLVAGMGFLATGKGCLTVFAWPIIG
jgi:hypothetical protein